MHNTTLLLYRNEDIYLDRPYKLNIPQSVDTLAELCQLLTSSIPLPDGCTQRGYRFLYTINGKALWRVRECIDSGVIVFSTTPGFLPRSSTVTVPTKTSSPPTPAMDISPDPRPVLGASPPIGTLEDDEHFVDRNYFNPAPTAAPLPLDEYDDFPYFSAPRNEEVATRKLFSEESARLSGGGKDYPSSFSRQQHQKSPSPVSGRSVVVGGKVYPLPPRPMFERIPETIVSKAQHPQTDYGRGLQLLLGRKWEAYRKQREIHPSERLCTEQYAQLAANLFQSDTFHPIISSSSQTNGAVVTISGPTGSGKSFSAAALVGEAVESYFGRDKLFYNYLLLPLDWSMFLSTEDSTAMGDLPGKLGCLWVTFPSIFQVMIRAVMDCVAAQRADIRRYAPLLAELWEKLILPAKVAPDFTSYAQLQAILPGDVLDRWNQMAKLSFPIIRAACREGATHEERDAALRIVCSDILLEIAKSFQFSGLFVVLDGLDMLSLVLRDGAQRPLGDMGVIAHALATSSAQTTVVLSWPAHLPATVLSSRTALVNMVGFVKESDYPKLQLPLKIVTHRGEFLPSIFQGAPGYLAVLNQLCITQKLKECSTVTAAKSLFLKQKTMENGKQSFVLSFDSDEVHEALLRLQQVRQPAR